MRKPASVAPAVKVVGRRVDVELLLVHRARAAVLRWFDDLDHCPCPGLEGMQFALDPVPQSARRRFDVLLAGVPFEVHAQIDVIPLALVDGLDDRGVLVRALQPGADRIAVPLRQFAFQMLSELVPLSLKELHLLGRWRHPRVERLFSRSVEEPGSQAHQQPPGRVRPT